MNAWEFWEKFKKNIYQNGELVKAWNNTRDFTNCMIEKLEKLVLAEPGMKTEREYFRIDLVGYKKRESAEMLYRNLQKYSWDLEVAVEHENDYRLWVDEVVKLAHVVCPLRVVIGYLPKSYSHTDVLNEVLDNLKEVKAWEASSASGDFLIIIGDCRLKKNAICERCIYTPYRYNYNKDKKIFEELIEETK